MDRKNVDDAVKLERGLPAVDPSAFEWDEVDPQVVAAQRHIVDVYTAWVDNQLRKGDAPFHPQGRPDGSDYNLHSVTLDADGTALDDMAAAIALAQHQPPPE